MQQTKHCQYFNLLNEHTSAKMFLQGPAEAALEIKLFECSKFLFILC